MSNLKGKNMYSPKEENVEKLKEYLRKQELLSKDEKTT